MKKHILYLLLLWLPVTMAAQDETSVALKEISAVIKSAKGIDCDYTMTKTSKMLRGSTTTNGHMYINQSGITISYNGKKRTIGNFIGTAFGDSRKFKAEATGNASEWIVKLLPQQKRLARMYSIITLHYNRKTGVVERIELQEKCGSKSDIRLYNIEKRK